MNADLETDVEIRDIAVFAELAVWEKRPDLRVLCATAQDRGALDEEAIDTVLPGLSPRARRNLLRHLGYLRLVGRDGSLTALGRRCASSGEAPAWEQGVYRLLVAHHPLFDVDHHVLDFVRVPGDGFDRDFDRREPLPSWFTPRHDRVFPSVFERSRRFSVAKFPAERGQDPVCRSGEMIKGKLRWSIDLASGDNEWTIEGQVSGGWKKGGGKFRSVSESVAVEPDGLADLLADWEPRWNPRTARVEMAYDGEIGPDGRESFRRSWKYGPQQAGNFGSFDEVEVRDVPVGPKTTDEARIWAAAILVARAEAGDGYMAPGDWRSEWIDAIEDTPLAKWAGDAPDPAELSEVGGRPLAARTRWLLTASADLSMEA